MAAPEPEQAHEPEPRHAVVLPLSRHQVRGDQSARFTPTLHAAGIDRLLRIAAARLNFNSAVLIHIKIEINAGVLLGLAANNFTFHAQYTRTFPQHFQRREKFTHRIQFIQIGVFQHLFRQSRIQVIVAQVGGHRYLFNRAVRLAAPALLAAG